MAALPYMQLYIADYLADTMHLSTEEHGAYLLLMFNYWQTGRPIPKKRLAKIARLPADKWSEIAATLSEFFEDDGDNWIHLRIERDIEAVTNSPRGKKQSSGGNIADFKGYLYFISSPDLETVKIGYSRNPWARLSELRRKYGSSLSVVATIKTVDKAEHSIHSILSQYRVEGEWFTKCECINALISAVVAGEITTVEATKDYVDNYGVATTATTNKDKDKDLNNKNLERNIRVDDFCPPVDNSDQQFAAPLGKFPISANWTPGDDFVRQAALWGINLGTEPGYQPEELQQFRDYWICENKVKHQQQWEQTFAQSLRTSRVVRKPPASDRRGATFAISEPDKEIPPGFRG